jgi:hypothetical protein
MTSPVTIVHRYEDGVVSFDPTAATIHITNPYNNFINSGLSLPAFCTIRLYDEKCMWAAIVESP